MATVRHDAFALVVGDAGAVGRDVFLVDHGQPVGGTVDVRGPGRRARVRVLHPRGQPPGLLRERRQCESGRMAHHDIPRRRRVVVGHGRQRDLLPPRYQSGHASALPGHVQTLSRCVVGGVPGGLGVESRTGRRYPDRSKLGAVVADAPAIPVDGAESLPRRLHAFHLGGIQCQSHAARSTQTKALTAAGADSLLRLVWRRGGHSHQ